MTGPLQRTARLLPMNGRDTTEQHRVATPLELFFDLIFVVCFSVSGTAFAHTFSEGHFAAAIGGALFVGFATIWAWIQYAWFASAFDTDDWLYRILTAVQMVGVVIIALGINPLYNSLVEGHTVDNDVLVLGYVVMRLALAAQWLRVALSSQRYRRTALAYVGWIVISQVGWVLVALTNLSIRNTLLIMIPLYIIEFAGPYLVERRATGTPWHPHHICERYGLLAIITLGESLVGAVEAIEALIHSSHGWNLDTVLLIGATMTIGFGMWWMYFLNPAAEVISSRPAKAFLFGYSHIPMLISIALVGAGFHVTALYLEHESHISKLAVVAAVAVPFFTFMVCLALIYVYLMGRGDISHTIETALSTAVLVAALLMAQNNVSVTTCLVVIACAPVIPIVGYEIFGRRQREEILATLDHE